MRQATQEAPRSDPWLWAILAGFLAAAVLWALRIPFPLVGGVGQWVSYQPDEGGHINVIVYVATHHALPRFSDGWIDMHNPRLPRLSRYYVGIHPPVYHILAALIYALLNPMVGSTRALMSLRLLSCVMGAGVVWLTYRTARELASRPAAVLAAGCVAGVPMFVSLAGAISNENLSTLAASASLFLIVVGLRRGFDVRRTWALAAWVAVGVGSKLTCLSLLPASFVALWWAGGRYGLPVAARVRQMAVIVLFTAALTGWWFVRNHQIYGSFVRAGLSDHDWDIMQPGFALVHQQNGTSALHYAFKLAAVGWRSFWGQFNGMTRPLPGAICAALLLLQFAILLGLFWAWQQGKVQGTRAIAATVMALAGAVIVFIYVVYSWKHYTPQGRYFFPLLIPFGLCMAAGWRALFPPRWKWAASLGLLAVFGLLNVFCLAAYAHS